MLYLNWLEDRKYTLSKMTIIQPVQALTDLSQHRLSACIVLNYATMPKFDKVKNKK